MHVKCYHLRLRKNDPIQRKQFDINDTLLLESPAKGVHNDIKFGSGQSTIGRYLPVDVQSRFLKPGYRVRIIKLPVLRSKLRRASHWLSEST